MVSVSLARAVGDAACVVVVVGSTVGGTDLVAVTLGRAVGDTACVVLVLGVVVGSTVGATWSADWGPVPQPLTRTSAITGITARSDLLN